MNFQVCSHLFSTCSGGAKPQSLKKDYAHAAEEIVCSSKIQSAWSGEGSAGRSAGGKVTGQNARVSGGRNAEIVAVEAESSSSALRSFIELAGQLLLTASTESAEGAQGDSKHSAAAHKARENGTAVTLLPITEFELKAENLLSPSSSAVQPSSAQSSPVLQYALSPALKAWIALLAAKTSLCVYSEHQSAYKWVRRALSYVVPRSSDAPRLGGMGGEGASCLAIDRCLPRLEVGQLSDVYRTVASAYL